MGVVADELPDLVHQEHDPLIRPPAVEVALHPLGEVLDRQREVALCAVHPGLDRRGALTESFDERGDDLIAVELPGITFLQPRRTSFALEGGVEDGELTTLVEVALHVGDVRMIAAVALLFVEDLQEYL